MQSSEGVITLKVASGFFMQDANGDGDSTTSDGIYVLGGVTSAGVGDLVRVKGTVAEYRPSGANRTVTEFKDTTSIVTLSSGHSITPTPVNPSGAHNGLPFITVGNGSVAPGASVTVTTLFNNPNKVAINYGVAFYAGAF